MKSISELLPVGAPFYFTVRLGEGAKWDQYDGGDSATARYIQLFSEMEILGALSELPFANAEYWIEESTWGRPSKWISVVTAKSR